MFTGIIKEVGTVEKSEPAGEARRLSVRCSLSESLTADQSICLNGVCHTVIESGNERFVVETVPETLRKTNIGELESGDRVNLEPAMGPDQMLDGHIVQGHVDATGMLEEWEKEGEERLFTIAYPAEYRGLVVGRGSICVDGISLTVAREEGSRFTVAVIPYTYRHTNLSYREPGDRLNLEFDILGKYVARQLSLREQSPDPG